MKRILQTLFLLTLLCMSSVMQAQSGKNEYNLDRLMASEGITVVYLSPSMMKLTGSIGMMKEDAAIVQSIFKQIESVYIFTAETQKDIQILKQEFSYLSPQKRNSGLYEKFMFVKNEEGTVELFGKMKGDIAKGIFLRVAQPENFTLIAIEGNFSRSMIEDIVREQEKERATKHANTKSKK